MSSYARGEYREVEQFCGQALSATEDAALTVRIIHLQLTATELWWSLRPADSVRALVDMAVRFAEADGASALRAMARSLEGRLLVATGSLPDAIIAFDEAVRLGAISGEPLAHLEALAHQGHHTIGRDLNKGRALLTEARRLVDGLDRRRVSEEPLLAVLRARLAGLAGVADFDAGRLGQAESLLTQSLIELRAVHAVDHLALTSNFLGQLLTATGRFEDGERVLLQALERLSCIGSLTTYQGYNMALLGKLHLERGDPDTAARWIHEGWRLVRRHAHGGFVPLVRNYLAELLMTPGYGRCDLDQARALLEETIAECRSSGFQRSEVGALALRAQADLQAGDAHRAYAASTAAVQRLETAGSMPALRTEEVYLIHHRVLRALGSPKSSHWLERARSVLLNKSASISDEVHRASMLRRVRVSRAILDGSEPYAYGG
ncbi:hypothetical protein [Spirillospora sp. CA-294931]|uniref:hypothetical protein n=1 Tax=Spirillospora sp. CA-294931 TaxID=3240042 RepID=UPI003D8D0F2E